MMNTNIFKRFPVLDLGDGFELRDYRVSDAENFMKHMQHEAIAKYLPDGCIPRNIDQSAYHLQQLRDIFNRQITVSWAIVDKAEDRLIGTCGFESWNRFHHRLEIAYDVFPNYWRRGIARKAVLAIMHFGFKQMKANRIEAYTLTDNIPSILFLENMFFSREAVLQQYRLFKGSFVDIQVLSLLKEDYMTYLDDYQKIQQNPIRKSSHR